MFRVDPFGWQVRAGLAGLLSLPLLYRDLSRAFEVTLSP
jgi:hypothetical protein